MAVSGGKPSTARRRSHISTCVIVLAKPVRIDRPYLRVSRGSSLHLRFGPTPLRVASAATATVAVGNVRSTHCTESAIPCDEPASIGRLWARSALRVP